MAIRAGKLQEAVRTIPVEYMGDTCRVTYRVGEVNHKLVERVMEEARAVAEAAMRAESEKIRTLAGQNGDDDAALEEVSDAAGSFYLFPALIERLVVKWEDVLDLNDEPLAPTIEALDACPLPTGFLATVISSIQEDASPNARRSRR